MNLGDHELVRWLALQSGGWLVLAGRQLLETTILCGVVWLVARALARRRPQIGHALWWLVFIRLLLPPTLSYPIGIWSLIPELGRPEVAVPSDADSTLSQGPSEALRAESTPPLKPLAVVVAWATGTALIVLRGIRQRRQIRRALRAARPVDDPEVLSCIALWAHRLGITRSVRVLTGPPRWSPCTVGILKPVVLVPERLMRSPEIEAVLAHELVHVARWDGVWLALQQLVRALYFFFPVVWIAGRQLGDERERLCDAAVVRAGIPARSYASAVVEVLAMRLEPITAANMGRSNRSRVMRVKSVLDPQCRRQRLGLATSVLILGVLAFPLIGGGQHAAGTAGGSPAVAGEEAASLQETGTSLAGTDAPVLIHPLPQGRRSLGWGEARSPWTGGTFFHRGIDLAADRGTPVRAAAAGVVRVATASFETADAGTVVIIDHTGGCSTYYGHLDSVAVAEGDQVDAGTIIGAVGNTGRSTGPHLHFEVRFDDVAVDPEPVLAR